MPAACASAPRLGAQFGKRGLVWTATLARSETGLFGRVYRFVKIDVFAAGGPRRARGPAIHAGSAHRIIKLAVRAQVAVGNGIQASRIAGKVGCFRGVAGCLLYTSPSPRDGLLSR